MKTKYCTIIGTEEQKDYFIKNLPYELDHIIEAVMVCLDMFPNFLDIRIYLYDDVTGVCNRYQAMYSRECNYKAFMDKHLKSIYLALSDFDVDTIKHEVGHVILETKYPNFPAKFHEDFAKFCVRYTKL